MKALSQLIKIIDKAKVVNNTLQFKILFTMYNKQTTHSQEIVDETKKFFPCFNTYITKTIKFSYSTVAGKSLVTLYPNTEQAQQYKNLAKEILQL